MQAMDGSASLFAAIGGSRHKGGSAPPRVGGDTASGNKRARRHRPTGGQESTAVATNLTGGVSHTRLALEEGAFVGKLPAAVKVEEGLEESNFPCAAEAVRYV